MSGSRPAGRKKWSRNVTEHSDALDLEHGVFAKRDPKKIAESLKESAEHSERRKSGPFRSAMSMLTFYLNRAGPKVSTPQRSRLEAAKDELRALFDRPAARREVGARPQTKEKAAAAKARKR
jgi:hypothetical protein